MAKLKIDLSALSRGLADEFRRSTDLALSFDIDGVRYADNKMTVEYDLGEHDLRRFTQWFSVWAPLKLIQRAIKELDPTADERDSAKLIEHFATPEYLAEVEDARETAERECREFDYQAPPDPGDAFDRPAREAIEQVLEDNDGIVIGGTHTDNTHRTPVIDALRNGEISQAAGTGLLFIEEMSATVQAEVDAFLDSPPGTPMAKPLQKYCDAIKDSNGGFDFAGMLDLARQQQVRVYGIDTAEAKVLEAAPTGLHHVERCAKMNIMAAEIMEQARLANPGQKFVALVGGEHVNTHGGGVPGLAQIFNVPGAMANASGTLRHVPENPANRAAPTEAEAPFIAAYIRMLDQKFDASEAESVTDHMHWTEQRAAALAMAQTLAAAGQLDVGADIDALMNTAQVQADLVARRDAGRQRTQRRKELVDLIEARDAAGFTNLLGQHVLADPDLLKFDGLESNVDSVAVAAVKAGMPGLIPLLAAQRAPLGDPGQSKALFQAAEAAFAADKLDVTVDDVTADANLTASLTHLLDNGVNPNGKNFAGDTPLQLMIEKGHAAQARLLVQRNADPNAKSADGKSMLRLAIDSQAPGVAEALIAGGVGINERDGQGSLLQNALRAKRTGIARALIDAGATLDGAGALELQLALQSGDQTLVDALVTRNPNPADPSAPGPDGKTGLQHAAEADIAQRIDTVLNTVKRDIVGKKAEVSDKADEIRRAEALVATLEQREVEIRAGAQARGTWGPDLAEMTRLVTTDLPNARAAIGPLQAQLQNLEGELDALKLTDPLRDAIAASEGRIRTLTAEIGAMDEDDAARPARQQMLKDEKAHLARLDRPQKVTRDLIEQVYADLFDGVNPDDIASITDIRDHIAAEAALDPVIVQARGRELIAERRCVEMKEALDRNDIDAVRALILADGAMANARIPDDVHERTALHYAASKLSAEMVSELLLHGGDLALTDKYGGTPLHALFARRQDGQEKKTRQAAIAQEMLDNGAGIDLQDNLGRTPLHLACLDGNADAITGFLQAGARTDIRDARGWVAQDVVVATTKPIAEKAFAEAAANNTLDRPLVADDEDAVSTVEILMRATRCEDPGDVARVREMLVGLYADPTLRPVLDLAALDAIRPHVSPGDGPTPTGLRIVVAADEQVGVLYNKTSGIKADGSSAPDRETPVGAYEETSHVVMLGAGGPEGRNIAGTLIHELTHACARIMFGESDIPCPMPKGGYLDQNGKMRKQLAADPYVKAIEADAKRSCMLANSKDDEEKHIYEVLFSRFNGNYKTKGDLALLQEYLVSVPQLISEYGLDKVSKVAPGLTNYFTGSFSEACKAKAASDDYGDVRDRVDNTAAIANAPPLRHVQIEDLEFKRQESVNVDAMIAKARQLYMAAKGTQGVSPTDGALADKLSLPFSPANYTISGRAEKKMNARMEALREILTEVYDLKELPTDISREKHAQLIEELTAAAIKKSGKSLEEVVSSKCGDFIRDARRSALELKLAKREEFLTEREIAELILIRAEDEAFTTANPLAPPPPKPHYDKEVHNALIDFMETKIRDEFPTDDLAKRRKRVELMHDPADFAAFIDAQKSALLAQGQTMRGKRGGDVKIDQARAKAAWYAALQQLAA